MTSMDKKKNHRNQMLPKTNHNETATQVFYINNI
jgi:hypothetical protein